MVEKRGHQTPPRDLTPRDKLRVAYFHEIEGLAQETLASLFLVNTGRVAEACSVVRKACGLDSKEKKHDLV